MKDWLFGGILGLLLGWTLQRCGLPRPCDVQRLLSLRQPRQTRTLITALGFTIVLAAGMGWLAVLDVDHFRVLPLHGGTILGALLMALAAGTTGYTPGIILTSLGGGKPGEALCALLGGLAAALCGAWLAEPLQALQRLFPPLEETFFRTTLTEPFLLAGGFWFHGAAGLIVLLVGLCVGRGKHPELSKAPSEPVPEATPTALDAPPTPEAAAAETVVASLPQEEPLAVDTAETTLPKEVTDALENKGKETHDKEPDEEKQAAMDPAERLLAGKTSIASEAMSAAEPVPLVRAAEDEEKKETDD